MGLFSKGESSAKTTDNRIAADGGAKIVQGGSTQIDVADGGQSVSGSSNNFGVSASSGAEISIQTLDPEVVSGALSVVENVVNRSTSAATSSQAATNALLKDLAESKQTDGQSGLNKNFVALAAGGLVAILAVAWVARKGGK